MRRPFTSPLPKQHRILHAGFFRRAHDALYYPTVCKCYVHIADSANVGGEQYNGYATLALRYASNRNLRIPIRLVWRRRRSVPEIRRNFQAVLGFGSFSLTENIPIQPAKPVDTIAYGGLCPSKPPRDVRLRIGICEFRFDGSRRRRHLKFCGISGRCRVFGCFPLGKHVPAQPAKPVDTIAFGGAFAPPNLPVQVRLRFWNLRIPNRLVTEGTAPEILRNFRAVMGFLD